MFRTWKTGAEFREAAKQFQQMHDNAFAFGSQQQSANTASGFAKAKMDAWDAIRANFGSPQQPSYHSADNLNHAWQSYNPCNRPEIIDFDSLETIPEYMERRREEIIKANEEADKAIALRKIKFEKIGAFENWKGWHEGVRLLRGDVRHTKPICAICDKPVNYITCKVVREHPAFTLAFFPYTQIKHIKYTVYCHNEQQSVNLTLEDIKEWLGFGIGKAFDYAKESSHA